MHSPLLNRLLRNQIITSPLMAPLQPSGAGRSPLSLVPLHYPPAPVAPRVRFSLDKCIIEPPPEPNIPMDATPYICGP